MIHHIRHSIFMEAKDNKNKVNPYAIPRFFGFLDFVDGPEFLKYDIKKDLVLSLAKFVWLNG